MCGILKASKGIKGEIKNDMVLVLREMIKYKLKDDKNKVRELLSMISEEVKNVKRGYGIWFEDEFAQIEAVHKKELADKDCVIADKDCVIAEKDSEIASKDARIAELEVLLKENGIE